MSFIKIKNSIIFGDREPLFRRLLINCNKITYIKDTFKKEEPEACLIFFSQEDYIKVHIPVLCLENAIAASERNLSYKKEIGNCSIETIKTGRHIETEKKERQRHPRNYFF